MYEWKQKKCDLDSRYYVQQYSILDCTKVLRLYHPLNQDIIWSEWSPRERIRIVLSQAYEYVGSRAVGQNTRIVNRYSDSALFESTQLHLKLVVGICLASVSCASSSNWRSAGDDVCAWQAAAPHYALRWVLTFDCLLWCPAEIAYDR